MPTSGRGSERRSGSRGFTLIELLVVIAIIALTSSLVAVALRDGSEQRLERDAVRLTVLLETARAESRASGLPVWWVPATEVEAPGFKFVGLTLSQPLPAAWLDENVRARVDGAARLQPGRFTIARCSNSKTFKPPPNASPEVTPAAAIVADVKSS